MIVFHIDIVHVMGGQSGSLYFTSMEFDKI